MAKKKMVGLGYLHRHSVMEQQHDIDADHVIVDRKDWMEVCQYFMDHPELTSEIKEIEVIYNEETG